MKKESFQGMLAQGQRLPASWSWAQPTAACSWLGGMTQLPPLNR
jgi:hypothetical protein